MGWFGISFPMVLVGLLFAVSWAAFWVTNLMGAKDKEGTYKTYIGGGMLPPEGYTNPLDPRVSEEYAQEDDPLYENKGSKSASSPSSDARRGPEESPGPAANLAQQLPWCSCFARALCARREDCLIRSCAGSQFSRPEPSTASCLGGVAQRRS